MSPLSDGGASYGTGAWELTNAPPWDGGADVPLEALGLSDGCLCASPLSPLSPLSPPQHDADWRRDDLFGQLHDALMDVESSSMAFRRDAPPLPPLPVALPAGGARKRRAGDCGMLSDAPGASDGSRQRRRVLDACASPSADAVHALQRVADATRCEQRDEDKVRDKCIRCSVTAKKTPMMRKGPDGCRSLCNACGLKWRRHGIY